jgi:perosamine synthetase
MRPTTATDMPGEPRIADARVSPPTIPLSVPVLGEREWEYVRECLGTNWVSSAGPFVERFERAVCEYLGDGYGAAAVNGTAALHTALLVAGVRPDDEVLVSTLTFIAPVNALRYVGAWPVFMDAESAYWQMDPDKVREFLVTECVARRGGLYNRSSGRRVRAILPVHILGHPCDMDPIVEAARRYDLLVIEDASEGIGTAYRGKPVGLIGDIGTLSFNGNKLITTGGGGMVLTRRADWAARARYLMTQAKDDPVEYVHAEIGYNYRLTNLQAALGVAQIEKLNDYVAAKRRIAERYAAGLAGVDGITVMREAPWARSTYWLYTVLVDEARYGTGSRGLLARLAQAGMESRPLWQPIHLSGAHRGAQAYRCDVSERLFRDALSLPCSVDLRPDDQARVIQTVLAGRSGTSG